jgi:hypothetical protein
VTRRSQAILAAVLAVQVVLAIVTWSTDGARLRGGVEARPLLDTATEDVLRITLVGEPAGDAGAEPERLVLARQGSGWVVESAGSYPAKPERVDELVTKLASATVREPIATQAVSHDALNVGERDYARRIIVETSAASETIVMGDGPRSSAHVRLAGDDEVYSARGIAVWNVRTDARSYIEPLYVDVDRQNLTAVTVQNAHGTLTFRSGDDGWSLAELPAASERDAAAIGALVNALSRLNIQAPVATELRPEYGLDDGAHVTLAWTAEDSTEALSYVVGAEAGDGSYYAKADGNDHVVTIPKYAGEQAVTKTPADFVKTAPAGAAD